MLATPVVRRDTHPEHDLKSSVRGPLLDGRATAKGVCTDATERSGFVMVACASLARNHLGRNVRDQDVIEIYREDGTAPLLRANLAPVLVLGPHRVRSLAFIVQTVDTVAEDPHDYTSADHRDRRLPRDAARLPVFHGTRGVAFIDVLSSAVCRGRPDITLKEDID